MPSVNILISSDEELQLINLQADAVSKGEKKPSYADLVRAGKFVFKPKTKQTRGKQKS